MTRYIENARTLSSLLGITNEEASKLLDVCISIRVDETDHSACRLARDLEKLLVRTVTRVQVNSPDPISSIEVAIGNAPATSSHSLRVTISGDEIRIGTALPPLAWPDDTLPLVLVLAAAYTAGMALKSGLKDTLKIPGPSPNDGMVIRISDFLGTDTGWMRDKITLSDTYLVGAGAIGNAFLYGLSHFSVSGSLVIADPDKVTDGNLNRCIFFEDKDIGLSKAIQLAERAQPLFPHCELIPAETTLQEIGKTRNGAWLRRVIVAVDSRRARRRLQTEIPGEVFDASTTGAVECVLHHHKQPTDSACLSCIYHEEPDELARERHIAEVLGVDVDLVKQHYVTAEAARRISQKYQHISENQLEGQAYDSLFKALCGEEQLKVGENRQVLAPFAFVSVLAGIILAIEVARRVTTGDPTPDFNYFRFSPWAPPVSDLKQFRKRNGACEFCNQPTFLRIAKRLWS